MENGLPDANSSVIMFHIEKKYSYHGHSISSATKHHTFFTQKEYDCYPTVTRKNSYRTR